MNGAGMGSMGTGTMTHDHAKRYLHMTFFWGKNTEVLFTGWPGTNAGMYALALIFMVTLSFLVEWLSGLLESLSSRKSSSPAAGFARTLLHTLRMGLALLIMLALMSFNGGIFIAIVAGHALGFFISRTRVFNKSSNN